MDAIRRQRFSAFALNPRVVIVRRPRGHRKIQISQFPLQGACVLCEKAVNKRLPTSVNEPGNSQSRNEHGSSNRRDFFASRGCSNKAAFGFSGKEEYRVEAVQFELRFRSDQRKLHEVMIPSDVSRHVVEYPEFFVIKPDFV
jgi:hypothetical protein